ncbi:MAG TPA: GNAT family N-acetyltransferase [Steroidobacteraceae bacterium]|jgi:RimJ/RimL family protein N-acetyltransferase|nr:GNAT family N-acetyltransferase [Steroidobacteraceae bacterium]
MFEFQPELIGQIIQLRPLRPADFDSLCQVASDPLIWDQHPDKSRSTMAGFRTFFANALESGGTLVAVDRRQRLTIGCSRFHAYREPQNDVIVGYTFLARSHWGGTYNAEMKRLMLDHAFGFVENVRFLIAEQNLRSRRAIEKLGAVCIDSEVHQELRIVHLVYQLGRAQYLGPQSK